jgi:hypothetical protein
VSGAIATTSNAASRFARCVNYEDSLRDSTLVAALLLETERTEALSDDKIDAYEPLLSVARHYGWTTAMSLVADAWAGKLPVPSPAAALLYGVIPADTTPETILSITRAFQAS